MTRLKLAVFSTLVAIGLHAYLAWNYYPLKFARSSGESLCNLSATFNCDAVAASNFSSFLGIPLALWGMTTNMMFLLVLLILALRLTDDNERALRNTFYLALFIAITSVVMGIISFAFLNTFCLFCIGTYICSFLTLAALWPLAKNSQWGWQKTAEDFRELLSHNKTFLILLIFIPALTYILHTSMVRQFGADKLKQVVNSSLMEWAKNPQFNIDLEPSLFIGPSKDKAKLVLVEFADFLCGHCKSAAPTIEAFAKSHSDVRFEFYSFALDGECNDAVSQKVGAPCALAKAVYCAGKINKGWEVHHQIFQNQDQFYNAKSENLALEKLKELTGAPLATQWEDFTACIQSEESREKIKEQGKVGDQVGVKGTPTFFANGRHLPRGQLLPVLQELYKSLK